MNEHEDAFGSKNFNLEQQDGSIYFSGTDSNLLPLAGGGGSLSRDPRRCPARSSSNQTEQINTTLNGGIQVQARVIREGWGGGGGT